MSDAFRSPVARGESRGRIGHVSEIAASLMCANPLTLGAELEQLELAGVDSIHLDVMDGHFVPNLGLGLDTCVAIRKATRLPVDLHMMVTDPTFYADKLAKAGFRRFIFHVESDIGRQLSGRIERAGMVPGVAISPSTPVGRLADMQAEFVLVMAVPPGFAGQRWTPGTEQRIGQVRALFGDSVVIGIDGNVNRETAAAAHSRGASLFVGGTSSIFSGRSDYRSLVRELRRSTEDPSEYE